MRIYIFNIQINIALKWIPANRVDGKSASGKVIASFELNIIIKIIWFDNNKGVQC